MIKFGISEIGIIPLRKEANHRSEMVSQILFGETVEILDQNTTWSYIKISNDGYQGWIETNSIKCFLKEEYDNLINGKYYITRKPVNTVFKANKEPFLIPAGSILHNFNEENKSFNLLDKEYLLSEDEPNKNFDLIDLAKQFINCPYLWGGKSALGIDCSGFVQIIFKMINISLPRDANEQMKHGTIINFISEVISGDLAYFDNEEGLITHVGILINNSEIIHASGKVRIDRFDQQGIYNSEQKKYTHKLRVIKRVL